MRTKDSFNRHTCIEYFPSLEMQPQSRDQSSRLSHHDTDLVMLIMSLFHQAGSDTQKFHADGESQRTITTCKKDHLRTATAVLMFTSILVNHRCSRCSVRHTARQENSHPGCTSPLSRSHPSISTVRFVVFLANHRAIPYVLLIVCLFNNTIRGKYEEINFTDCCGPTYIEKLPGVFEQCRFLRCASLRIFGNSPHEHVHQQLRNLDAVRDTRRD